MAYSGEIAKYCRPALERNSTISITSNEDNKNYIKKIEDINKELEKIINRKINECGLANINPLEFSGNPKEYVTNAIKNDNTWQELYKELIKVSIKEKYLNLIDPSTEKDHDAFVDSNMAEFIESVNIPWWNEINLFLEKEEHEENSLKIGTKVHHSYITQLIRKGKIKSTMPTLSISGIIKTSDEKIILGLRGGHSLSGSVMTSPAGYNSYKDPLLYAFLKELEEELSLTENELILLERKRISPEIIGRVVSSGGEKAVESNTLYVFSAETQRTSEEVKKIWENASDQEHTELIELENNPDAILEYMKKTKNLLIPGELSIVLYLLHHFPDAQDKIKEQFQEKYQLNLS